MSGLRERLAEAIGASAYGYTDPVETPNNWGSALHHADAAILALRQWMEEEGLVCVPKSPSQDQFRAGSAFRFAAETHGYKNTAGIYEAMIAAAPDPLGDGL